MKIVCAGYMVRYPLGGHQWHELQYLVGLRRLGHEVLYVEDWGWPASCYDAALDRMTTDPRHGIAALTRALERCGLGAQPWCYLAEDGTTHGMARPELARRCAAADLYLDLGGVNAIGETEQCRRRVLVDFDPVFTQLGSHGLAHPFAGYDVLFTYAENMHQAGCTVPTAGRSWLPTRQPVVLDLWPETPADPGAPITTVMNWSAYGETEHEGVIYGQKDRQFRPFFTLAREVAAPMELAVSVDAATEERLRDGGWAIADPRVVTRDTESFGEYVRGSRAEFSVAKHAYVATASGWFSDRTATYLASGRPAVVEDTGFTRFLPAGDGLLPFTTKGEAVTAIESLRSATSYGHHCRAARHLAATEFSAERVLRRLLELSG